MTILLSGATGFLGSHLLKKFYELNYNVVILKRSTSNTWRIDSLPPNIKSYDIDIVSIKKPFQEQRIDFVINAATSYGRDGSTVCDVVNANLMFSLQLLETAANFNVESFLNADTFFNSNAQSYKYLEHYVLSKKQFAEWLRYFSDKIKIINLKLQHVYGPKDSDTKFVAWLIKQLRQNMTTIELTEGRQKRDFIYIDDVVDVYVLILKNLSTFKTFEELDVGTGRHVELKEFILSVYDEISKIQPLTTKLLFGAKDYREGEFMDIKENLNPLYSLGWRPRVSLSDGIKKVVQAKE